MFVGRDANGKRTYKSKTVRGTKQDAERALRKWLTEGRSLAETFVEKVTRRPGSGRGVFV